MLINHYLLAGLGEAEAAARGEADPEEEALPGDFFLFSVFLLLPSSTLDMRYQIDPPIRAAKISKYTYLAPEGTSWAVRPKNFILNASYSAPSFSAYLSSLFTCISSSKFLINLTMFS